MTPEVIFHVINFSLSLSLFLALSLSLSLYVHYHTLYTLQTYSHITYSTHIVCQYMSIYVNIVSKYVISCVISFTATESMTLCRWRMTRTWPSWALPGSLRWLKGLSCGSSRCWDSSVFTLFGETTIGVSFFFGFLQGNAIDRKWGTRWTYKFGSDCRAMAMSTSKCVLADWIST